MPSVLKLYDIPLLEFTMDNQGLDGFHAAVTDYDKAKMHLLPLDLTPDSASLTNWLRRRVIPKNRAFVHQILKQLGLSLNDTKGIIEICMGLSLNDSYWIVPGDFGGMFADYNLYENPFSKMLSLVAYTGYGTGNEPFTTSPELTTDGMLPKSWRVEGGTISLWKGGSVGAANAGMEPYSEFFAAQVAEAMGLDHVHYDLRMWKRKLCSVCPIFTDIDTAYIPAGRIVNEGGLPAVLDYYRGLSDEAYQAAASMLVFDAVVYNEDRHFGNFGVLRNSHTGEVLGAAPIFDHGLSLFNYALDDELDDLDIYASERFAATGVSHDEIVRQVMGPKQKAELRKLIGFEFKPHKSYTWPAKRRRAIQAFIQRRVTALLAM
ncbi:XRE family transcriptional regulator [Ruminococcaceae bacterium OttesenSCG-928-D13]|nr:XRE family transcriptional regulator [Ruminococcaceae bacterium OttesenSCG-928-D13]